MWTAISACDLMVQSADTRFVTFVHEEKVPLTRLQAWQEKRYDKLLINKVFASTWRIIYSVPQECSSAKIKAQLEKAMRQMLRQWLYPLRTISIRPLVNTFIFTEQLAFNKPNNKNDEYERIFSDADIDQINPHLRVIFYCKDSRSYAYDWTNEIHMFTQSKEHKSLHIGDTYFSRSTLLHEIGHTFGLADTYVETDKGYHRFGITSSGGLENTIGKQPYSVMAGLRYDGEPSEDNLLGKDDIEGIRWLYRYFHEKNTNVETCPHADYELEIIDKANNLKGCRPSYPLIFEIKQGHIKPARWLIQHAFDVEINAQDSSGNTALHYAARYGFCNITRDLLAKSYLYRGVTNNDGHTPLEYAEERGHDRIVALLQGEEGARCKVSKSLCSTIGQAGRTESLVLLLLLLLPTLLCVRERCSHHRQRV